MELRLLELRAANRLGDRALIEQALAACPAAATTPDFDEARAALART
jgi:hypothetical protein